MIASKEDPRWTALLSGEIQPKFQLASAAMIVTRCQREVTREPQSMNKNINELHAFFSKFENVVGDDLKSIFS